MNKVLVDILLPASGTHFDVYIPLDIMMYEAVRLVSQMLTDLSGGNYRASADAVLSDAQSGMIYNVNIPVAETGIRNGSKLMLV